MLLLAVAVFGGIVVMVQPPTRTVGALVAGIAILLCLYLVLNFIEGAAEGVDQIDSRK